MKLRMTVKSIMLVLLAVGAALGFPGLGRCSSPLSASLLELNVREYFETRGLNVLVFSNYYDRNFGDSKISGIEIVHHGVRTATNGDVRLNPTPEQWDPIPELVARKVSPAQRRIEVSLRYPEHGFSFTIRAEARDGGMLLSVHLEDPLPEALAGKAGFQLEFLPSAYCEKGYLMDGQSGIFPLYPGGPMRVDESGSVEPQPIATGRRLVLAPEDAARRVKIAAKQGELQLLDGRNKAQNGWFVVRSVLPADQTGTVAEWFVAANTIPGWTRPPVIAHSQVGYHPDQRKLAVIELDVNDKVPLAARLWKVTEEGGFEEKFGGPVTLWGKYLRYNYATFDFSNVRESGLYVIGYGNVRTEPFRIAADVYKDPWTPTLDVFFPVQMDHVLVNEAYRVWHGASHLDDALQAPVNHQHFDLYAQGPTTETPYRPGEHIPGLNVGGWYDAGDFDIRTQTQYATVLGLVQVWETFEITRDQTTVDEARRYVDIHVPDGIPDLLQQIEHGTLQLLAQHRAVGHAIPGIIAPDLSQYTHLGDGSTKTDNVVSNSQFKDRDTNGPASGKADDRWAFTSKSTALNYGSIAALAAASRALRDHNEKLANECLSTAMRVWDEEHSHEPDIFYHGNTTGGPLQGEELKAAVELLICTGEPKYVRRINELWPVVDEQFGRNAAMAVRAMPHMDADYRRKLAARVRAYEEEIKELDEQNPFGVPIATGGWGGSGRVIAFAVTNYVLHKAFPDVVGTERTLRGLNYIYGCHPDSDISFVSGVGTRSKKVAYGNNRADYSFIAGGIVPGVLILKPDFPENKEDWPFLWGENEYVIGQGPSYLFLVNAVEELLNGTEP